MADIQPVEPEVQLLGDPALPVVNPPVTQNENENVAQLQELEVFVLQSLLDVLWYTSLSVASFRFFLFLDSEADGMLNGFRMDQSLLSKLVPEVVDLVSVVSS